MKKLVLVGLAVTFFAAGIFAQQPTPPAKPEPDVVRITTTLIQIDATVTDKKGNVVTGLTADDFEIYENGEKQKITNFSFVNILPQPASIEGGFVKPDKSQPKLPSVPMRLKPEEVRRTIALVVDDLGLSFGSVNAVRDALKKFVDQQMQPGDLVAIVQTGKGMGALQQFTTDKQLLYAAIDRIKFNLGGRNGISAFDPIRPTDKQEFNANLSFTSSDPNALPGDGAVAEGGNVIGTNEDETFDIGLSQFNDDVFAVGTLGAFNYVVQMMNKLPGRKAAILFSEGFDLFKLTSSGVRETNPRVLSAVRDLAETANRASVIVYTVDPRGLVAPGATSDDYVVGLRDNPSAVTDALRRREENLGETQQSLEYLARETGGFSYLNQNDISYGINKVLDDQKGYYLLGYQPDDETFDPKKRRYNKLEIKLKRPDLKIRYRNGFFSQTDQEAKPAPKNSSEQMLDALVSPFTQKEIDLKLTAYFVDRAKVGATIETLVHVDTDKLKFTADADGWQTINFEVLAVVFGENGAVVEMVNRNESVRATPIGFEEIRNKGLIYTLSVPVKKPGGYQMRFVLRDTDNKKIGSASQYVEVPDLKKKRLTLSGIALQGYQPDEIINASQSSKRLDVSLRQFRVGTKLQFVFDIYNAKAKTNLTTRFRLFRGNRGIYLSPENSLPSQSAQQTLNVGGTFTIDKALPPGEYILQVLVKDGAKEQYVSQWIDFEVVK